MQSEENMGGQETLLLALDHCMFPRTLAGKGGGQSCCRPKRAKPTRSAAVGII